MLPGEYISQIEMITPLPSDIPELCYNRLAV